MKNSKVTSSKSGRVRERHCCHSLPSEPDVRLSPHPAQAATKPRVSGGAFTDFYRLRGRRGRPPPPPDRDVGVPPAPPQAATKPRVSGGTFTNFYGLRARRSRTGPA